MKIINGFNLASVKGIFTRAAMVGIVAGAALMAAPQKANAQFAVGVRIGHARVGYVAPPPVYVAPAYGYYGPNYYAPRVYAYGYDRRGWDHRDRRFR